MVQQKEDAAADVVLLALLRCSSFKGWKADMLQSMAVCLTVLPQCGW